MTSFIDLLMTSRNVSYSKSKIILSKIDNIKRASCEMRKYQIYTKAYYMHQTNLFPFILVFGFYFGEN